MGIILHHTLRSIRANKGQSIVIVLTVTVVTMLFFVSLSIGDLFYNLQLGIRSRIAGETDVHISGEIFSGEMFDEFIGEHENEVEYVDKYLSMAGLVGTDDKGEATVVRIDATDMNVFLSRYKNKIKYRKGIDEGQEYVYPGILIGKALSEKQGYDVGDEVEIYLSLYERYERFTVTYIVENEGFFANSTVYTVLTDLSAFGDKGLYTDAYIKLAEGTDKTVFMQALTEKMDNPNLEISEAVDYAYIERVVNNNEKLLTVGIIFIVAIVIFILTGSYLVLGKNRVVELSVFKAAGATPVQTFFIILSEGVVYGLIGGLVGTVAARLAMQIAVMLAIPTFKDAVTYSVWNYVLSMVLGVVISVLSELIPAINLTKKSLKKVDANTKKSKKINPWFLLIPTAVMIAMVACIIFVGGNVELFTVILIMAVVALMIIGSPYLFSVVSAIFSKVRGIGKLVSFSIKRNGEAVSLSCMIGAVIAFTFIAVSIVNVIIDASKPYNSRFEADYAVQTFSKNIDMHEINVMVSKTPGVEYSCLMFYQSFDAMLDGKESNYTVYSAESSADLRCATKLTQEEKEAFDNEDTAAVFGYDMMNRLNVKKGDKVNIAIGAEIVECKIVAVDYTVTQTDRVIYVNEAAVRGKLENSVIFLRIRDDVPASDLYADLNEKLSKNDCFILQFNNWAYATSVGIGGIKQILRFLEVIVGFVCLIGVINLTISMMMSRAKEFGIYRAVGLDTKKYYELLVGEGLSISLTGSIIGFLFSCVISLLIPSFAGLIDRYINMTFPVSIFAIMGIIVAAYVAVYCIVGSRYKMKKLSIERNTR